MTTPQRSRDAPESVAQADLVLDGFQIVHAALNARQCDRTSQFIDLLGLESAGSRSMLDHSWCAELASQIKQLHALKTLLPVDAVAIQCTLFEKSEARNWLVALHQDLSVCFAKRLSASGWAGWSEKEGLMFARPPHQILAELLAVRIHLDDCPVSAGALRVVPKSHRLKQRDINLVPSVASIPIPLRRGDALLLRPLLVHASSKTAAPSRRRVLHFLFAPSHMHGLPETFDGAVPWR